MKLLQSFESHKHNPSEIILISRFIA